MEHNEEARLAARFAGHAPDYATASEIRRYRQAGRPRPYCGRCQQDGLHVSCGAVEWCGEETG